MTRLPCWSSIIGVCVSVTNHSFFLREVDALPVQNFNHFNLVSQLAVATKFPGLTWQIKELQHFLFFLKPLRDLNSLLCFHFFTNLGPLPVQILRRKESVTFSPCAFLYYFIILWQKHLWTRWNVKIVKLWVALLLHSCLETKPLTSAFWHIQACLCTEQFKFHQTMAQAAPSSPPQRTPRPTPTATPEKRKRERKGRVGGKERKKEGAFGQCKGQLKNGCIKA